MIPLNLKVFIATDYLLFALPEMERAVLESDGEVVGYESEINPISINRSIKRLGANLLILAISDNSSCKLVRVVKKKHPSVVIITIAKKLRQVPKLIKTKMVKAILFINEDRKLLIRAITEVVKGNRYYSPKVSQEMAREIAADLTPREKQIWDLKSEGKTRGEIARTLKISYSTVCTHIRNIERKRDIDRIV